MFFLSMFIQSPFDKSDCHPYNLHGPPVFFGKTQPFFLATPQEPMLILIGPAFLCTLCCAA